MEQREDVVVVGAGVVGLCSALALIEAGRGVRVLDAGRVGGGSSHGNCGTITPSHAPPLAAPGMVATALRMMLTPDAPLYIRPRLDPTLWRWLLRFAGRCNLRDWEASARAKSGSSITTTVWPSSTWPSIWFFLPWLFASGRTYANGSPIYSATSIPIPMAPVATPAITSAFP